MTESNSILQLLAVDNDPATVRDIQNLVSDPDLVLHFADTGNAFSRILESEEIDLAIMHIHAGSIGLLAPLSRHLQDARPPIALVAMVDSDPASACAAATTGVQACVQIDDTRTLHRILGERIELIRTLKQQTAMLNQVADIHERYNLLLESSPEAIAYLHQGLHIYANPSYLQQFGYESFEELEGDSILDLLSSTGDGQDLKQLLKSLDAGKLPDEALDFTAVRADGSNFR
ncbi:MAG: PAS domain S-box protein [Xanthomonadaceae bacterium]|nr:PAS domain S-box protein [Xanthomonadaceae bacterium]